MPSFLGKDCRFFAREWSMSAGDQERSKAINDLVNQARTLTATGTSADIETLLETHAELMPELGEELSKVMEARESFPKLEGYMIIGKLGVGGMGVVYRGVQL